MTLQNLQKKMNFSKVILGHLQGGVGAKKIRGGRNWNFVFVTQEIDMRNNLLIWTVSGCWQSAKTYSPQMRTELGRCISLILVFMVRKIVNNVL